MKIYVIELIDGYAYRTSKAAVAAFPSLNPGELQSWACEDVIDVLTRRDDRIAELERQVAELEGEVSDLKYRLDQYVDPQTH